MLYNTQIDGTLESSSDGEPHGESFVRYYAAQVVMALEFMHLEGVVSRTVDPTNRMVDRSGNLRMINLRPQHRCGLLSTWWAHVRNAHRCNTIHTGERERLGDLERHCFAPPRPTALA
ncbi:uncharacterized protein PITG_08281 [Phytophthora infestans T30-4]|uniref:Protein kinase domain-containing protein n=1 Tax=Phytophthora infestans (strain T30-4) TaxID=403677 RepID=D0NA82_PHYIT|nr:uncharacterized protein PITG_08281 [Phytophthora infestans T30-4]EEY54740.1 conserved hypothetical protein [Phytophthora infestans T30-4]|eukprot:XP_002903685.1 conserved hypothetical protein [Phytophthora infestans T30-4]